MDNFIANLLEANQQTNKTVSPTPLNLSVCPTTHLEKPSQEALSTLTVAMGLMLGLRQKENIARADRLGSQLAKADRSRVIV